MNEVTTVLREKIRTDRMTNCGLPAPVKQGRPSERDQDSRGVPAARISASTHPVQASGTRTVIQPGSRRHGSANDRATASSAAMLAITAARDCMPGGSTRLISASTATTANGTALAPQPRPQNGNPGGCCSSGKLRAHGGRHSDFLQHRAGPQAVQGCRIYIAVDPRMTGREVEPRDVDILRQVKEAVTGRWRPVGMDGQQGMRPGQRGLLAVSADSRSGRLRTRGLRPRAARR